MTETQTSPSPKGLNIALWCVQTLLFVTFVGTGLWKLLTPIPELAAKMPWMGQVSPAFLVMTAVLDLLGGLGIFLPSLTRIRPTLTVLGALGCVALMVGATFFHLQRGEGASTPFNVLLIILAGFVAWGRFRAAPISGRE